MTDISKAYIYNKQLDTIDIHDALLERITKADSLIQVGVLDHIMENVGSDVGNYLWVISDLLGEIKELFDNLPAPKMK